MGVNVAAKWKKINVDGVFSYQRHVFEIRALSSLDVHEGCEHAVFFRASAVFSSAANA